jgi:hypothetical protein
MGQKRRELVRRAGYDAKNAAHLIRLLRMGIEFLTEGTLLVEHADAAELLDIKRGAWSLEKVKAEAERLFQLAQEAYVRSTLPPEPDRPRAERLCSSLRASSAFEANIWRSFTKARMIWILTRIALGLLRTPESMAMPCSVNAYGNALRIPPQPEVTICDFKSLNSSRES